MTTVQKTMGERIAELRAEKGYTQNDMARMTNMSQPNYSRWEIDKVARIIPEHITAIAMALNTTPEYLLGIEDEYAHHKDGVKQWLKDPKSVPFVEEAFKKYWSK